MHPDYQLNVKQLSYSRAEKELFRNLNFSISAGHILQIIGPNGVGKTTLIRLIAGLIAFEQGLILWCGKDIREYKYEYNQHMAYLGHQLGVSLTLTPLENLQIITALHGVNTKIFYPLLEQLNLLVCANQITGQLSAGQQRRVALACVFIRQAPLLILDEPFAALDQSGCFLIEQLLLNHVNQGGLAIITTHQNISLANLPIQKIHLTDLSLNQLPPFFLSKVSNEEKLLPTEECMDQ